MHWLIRSDSCSSIPSFRRILVASFVFVAFVVCGSFSAQAQNLISNSDFTSPASGYASSGTFPYTVGGWTFYSNASGATTPVVFDGSGSTKTPTTGNSVQLTVSDNTSYVLAAVPTLTTALVAGTSYTLTFEEYSHSSQHSGIALFVGGVFVSNDNVGNTAASTSGFLANTITFTVTAAEVAAGGNLSFQLYQPSPGGTGLNAAFGNVSLTVFTPEPNPAAGIAILSLGIACTVERRRMRRALHWLKNRLLSRAGS
jgi:hypothetical protein